MKVHLALILCLVSQSLAQSVVTNLRAKYFKPQLSHDIPAAATSKDSGSKPSIRSQPCGKKLTLKEGDSGYIETPNYPNNYEAGVECAWSLNAAPGSRIHLTVFDIRTYSDPFTETADSVFISLIGEWSEAQRYSGDLNALTPIHLVSQGQELLIRFKSSVLGGNRRGFRMGYHVRGTVKPGAAQPADDVLTVTCPFIPVSTPAVFPDSGHSRKVNCPQDQDSIAELTRVNPTPYLVGIVLDDKQFCSGALISEDYVVTSAHCTDGAKKIELIFGTSDLSISDSGVQKRSESHSSVHQHPGFSPSTGLNDISIVRLSKAVQLTRFVKPVQLPSWALIQDALVGVEVQVSGWGDKDGIVSPRTTTSPVQINSNVKCRSTLFQSMSGMMVCIDPGNEACTADSGSPIATSCDNPDLVRIEEKSGRDPCTVTPNILLGVMSFGNCDSGFAFTRLAAHLDFIGKITGEQLLNIDHV